MLMDILEFGSGAKPSFALFADLSSGQSELSIAPLASKVRQRFVVGDTIAVDDQIATVSFEVDSASCWDFVVNETIIVHGSSIVADTTKDPRHHQRRFTNID